MVSRWAIAISCAATIIRIVKNSLPKNLSTDSEYRDFVLSRFRGEPELLEKSHHIAAQDEGWNTQVTIILQPYPRLSPAKREVLENDYQMQNG